MKLFKIITPLTILFILLVASIIDSCVDMKSSRGWSAIGIIVGLPIAVAVFFADFFTRTYFKTDVKKIWLYEFIIMIVVAIVYVVIAGY